MENQELVEMIEEKFEILNTRIVRLEEIMEGMGDNA